MEAGASSSSATTATDQQQQELEDDVSLLFSAFAAASNQHTSMLLELWRDEHVRYLKRAYYGLSSSYTSLDSSRPWLCYWILHSLAMLNQPFGPKMNKQTVDFLSRCKDPHGGYGGGPGQIAHLATTYAAVNALVTLGGEKALASIDRPKVLNFLLHMKQPSGGFTMHEGGEIDVRGCYTAISVAHILDILVPELVENVAEYISSCQTYEGGIAAEPGAEAHGGYTFCGLAALVILDKVQVLDLPNLVSWVVFRQGRVEGGFQGRTNKLVDGCYSFWQGGIFSIIQRIMPELNRQQMAHNAPLWAAHEQIIANSDSRTDEDFTQVASTSSSTHIEEVSEGHEAAATTSQTVEELSSREEKLPVSGLKGVESSGTSGSVDPILDPTTSACLQPPDSPLHSKLDKCEVVPEGSSSREPVTAEELFPVVNHQVKRVPISVTFEEISEDVAEVSQEGIEETDTVKRRRSSFIDQMSKLDEQVLYGPLYNPQALQGYILLCCQILDGGLRDKPGKSPDYYHTCYCLSGLTLAQNGAAHRINAPPPPNAVLGPYTNLLEPVHPLCNVDLNKYYEAVRYFRQQHP